MAKQPPKRLKITKVISDDYFTDNAGAVPEIIADLAERQAQAIADGYDGLFVVEEFGDDGGYPSLVAERYETDEEMSQRLAAEKQFRAESKLARQNVVEAKKARQVKELAKLTKQLYKSQLSEQEINAALADACACKRSKAGYSPDNKS